MPVKGTRGDVRLFESVEVEGIHIEVAYNPVTGEFGGDWWEQPGVSDGRMAYLFGLAEVAAAEANGWPVPAFAKKIAAQEHAEPTVSQPARVIPYKAG